MIIETMNYVDIREELFADMEQAYRFAQHLETDRIYRKAVLSHPDGYIHFKPVPWTSARKNHYLMMVYSPSKREFKQRGNQVCVSPLCWYRHKGGIEIATYYYANELREDMEIDIFTDHFFQRYNERYLHKPLLGKMEVITAFWKNEMAKTVVRPAFHPEYGLECMKLFAHGCSFAELVDGNTNCLVNHTFLTGDMLHNEQNSDMFLMECERWMENATSANEALRRKFREKAEDLQIEFSVYKYLRSMVREKHSNHDDLREMSENLYKLIEPYLKLTENETFKQYGEHLRVIANSESNSEIEALVETEDKGFMQ